MGVTRRATVLGNGGSGKTVFSLELARATGLPVHHMDRIQFRPGWEQAPHQEIEAELAAILAQDDWIIDGLGQIWTIERRLPHCDIAVFLDLPIDLCIARAIQRQADYPDGQRPDVAPGCDMRGTEDVLVDLLRRVDRDWMPHIRALAASDEHKHRFVVVDSPDEADAALTAVTSRLGANR